MLRMVGEIYIHNVLLIFGPNQQNGQAAAQNTQKINCLLRDNELVVNSCK